MDILNWFGRTALELIGQGGLGYTLDPLDSPAHNEYGDAIKEFLYVVHVYLNKGLSLDSSIVDPLYSRVPNSNLS